jgi:hypothetical protein
VRLGGRAIGGLVPKPALLAGTNEREVSRALSRLSDIGALVCITRGKYALHPQAAWIGPLASREAAELSLTD